MKKHIAEDLPARKYSPAASSPAESDKKDDRFEKSGGVKTPEKQARQAVYDIRYRARREGISLMQAYSQYMQSSNLGAQVKTLVRQLLSGKSSTQAEEFNIQDAASTDIANALYRVFVEGTKNGEPIRLTYMEKLETADKKKYKVRVTDPKNKVTYVRYATRQKISELRNKGLDVEMTGYGKPYEGEREKGEQTAQVLGGRKPNDGNLANNYPPYDKVTRGDVVAGALGKDQMGGKRKVKEAFLSDAADELMNVDSTQDPEIDVMRGKNKVVLNPELPGSKKDSRFQVAHHELQGTLIRENGYRKFLKTIHSLQEKAESEKQQKLFGLALSVKIGKTPRSEVSAEVLKIVDSMSEAEIRKFAKTKHKGLPVHKEEFEDKNKNTKNPGCSDDPRSLPTTKSLIRTRLRSSGIRDPLLMVAGYEPEGEVIDETKLGRAASELRRRRTASGDTEGAKRASKLADAQFSFAASPETHGKSNTNRRKQQDRQSDEREKHNDDDDHPSLSARERNYKPR